MRERRDPPAVVFVTAHAQYAVDAFALEAFDYLLKPVDPERLARVIERLRERNAERRAARSRRSRSSAGSGATELLDFDEVHYVQAEGDYSRVHTYDRCVPLHDPARVSSRTGSARASRASIAPSS